MAVHLTDDEVGCVEREIELFAGRRCVKVGTPSPLSWFWRRADPTFGSHRSKAAAPHMGRSAHPQVDAIEAG